MSTIESPWLGLSALAEREGVSAAIIKARVKDRRPHNGVYYHARPRTEEDPQSRNTKLLYRSVRHETPRPTMGARYEITRGAEAELTDRLDGVRMNVRNLEQTIEAMRVELAKTKGALDDEREAHKETRMELHRARGKG